MLKPGDFAPDFTLPDIHGVEYSLAEILGRGPVLLAFFKISCPVCQYTLPFLERATAGGLLHVFGVSQDDRASTVEFLKRYDLHFPTLLDLLDAYPVSNAYKLTNVPTMYVVEKDNSISWASSGFQKRELEELALRFTTEIIRPDDRVPESRPG